MTPREIALRCRHAQHELVCDRIEPWEHGTHVRATAFPTYHDFNCIRVEHGQPPVDALLRAADRLQAGLAHRRVDVEDETLGARLREGFDAAGWRTTRLVWMVLDGPPAAPEQAVEEVAFRDIRPLRAEWADDFSPEEISAFAPVEEEVAARMGCRTFVVRVDGRVAAFALWSAVTREIRLVYTSPAARGRGLARRLVGAAARACGSPVVIAADDEARAKELYARIGFVPAWTAWEFTRRPTASSSATR